MRRIEKHKNQNNALSAPTKQTKKWFKNDNCYDHCLALRSFNIFHLQFLSSLVQVQSIGEYQTQCLKLYILYRDHLTQNM